MAHKKGASSSRNGRDSNPQFLGVKRFGGQPSRPARSWSASAAPSSTRAPASAAATTTRCSRWSRATSSSASPAAARPSASSRPNSSRPEPRPHRLPLRAPDRATPARVIAGGVAHSVAGRRRSTTWPASSTASCCTCPPATAATGSPRSTARSSSRSAARTAATAAAAATSSSIVDANVAHPARLPPPPPPARRQRQAGRRQPPQRRRGRRPGTARPRRHRGRSTSDGTVLADLTGAGTRFVAAQRRPRRAGQLPRWPRPAARPRASRCSASPARPATSSSSSRAWPTSGWSASQRRQVVADRRDVGGPAQDRRLPVHHAGAQPRRRQRGRARRTPSPTCPA